MDSPECMFAGDGETGMLTWGGECEAEACIMTEGEETGVAMD